jgi:outer membrane protein OmpA-like peptidoglycan-associated protein
MLQLGYDSRGGKFDQVITPCNCPADLAIELTYVTIEPSLRIAPFKSNFYIYVGPRFAFTQEKSFTYKQGVNPAAVPAQTPNPDVNGNLSDVHKSLISMQVGAGIDIPLSSSSNHTQFVLSPFVAYHPYFGAEPRSVETWNVNTLRAGIALKFGTGHKIALPEAIVATLPVAVVVVDPEVQFTVNSPTNIPTERRVRETFPLRNYVFFNLETTVIPDRYVMLQKDQVKEFREDNLEVYKPKYLSGRSARQMTVYYNVLNILGDRMIKNPSATITLVGSSNNTPKEGREMAESVKTYLVTVFDIDPSRIKTEGRNKPVLPAEHPGGVTDLVLLREGDRRVSIESSSPALLMEFQSGPEAPLRPVEIVGIQEAPIDSYVSFNVAGGDNAFSTWSLEISDETGTMQNFGPYTQEKVSIPGKAILGTRPEGNYKVVMIGQTKSGKTVRKESTVHMVLWTPSKSDEMMRFSVLYEFDKSKTIALYEKYLTEIVTPKIPIGGTVIIHGHTDIIGEEAYNLNLSIERANDVKSILEKALKDAGRSDVKFEVSGFGEDLTMAPFDNKYPEERFYNRTVIIDIIPAK